MRKNMHFGKFGGEIAKMCKNTKTMRNSLPLCKLKTLWQGCLSATKKKQITAKICFQGQSKSNPRNGFWRVQLTSPCNWGVSCQNEGQMHSDGMIRGFSY